MLLSDAELERLLKEYGKPEVDRAIAYIDEAAQSSGNKNRWKDWNLVVRRCIREGWGKRVDAGKRASTDGYAYDDSDLDFIPN